MSFLLLFIIHHLFLFCLFRALDHLAPTLREVDSLEKPDNNFFSFSRLHSEKIVVSFAGVARHGAVRRNPPSFRVR